MISKTLIIKNAQGLHMRPAGLLAAETAKFDSDVTLRFNGQNINAKSLMNIIAAGIKGGSTVELVCEGADEDEALQRAASLIESGFGE